MLIPEKDMKAPRLELRWTDDDEEVDSYICEYRLVFPVRHNDLRNHPGNPNWAGNGLVYALLGVCRSTGVAPAGMDINNMEAYITTPYRDGAHAEWDSEQLHLPVYAVYQGMAQELPRLRINPN